MSDLRVTKYCPISRVPDNCGIRVGLMECWDTDKCWTNGIRAASVTITIAIGYPSVLSSKLIAFFSFVILCNTNLHWKQIIVSVTTMKVKRSFFLIPS